MRIKYTTFILVLASVCMAQTKPSLQAEPAIDWSKLNPQMIELALDQIDASDRASEVLDRGEIVYAPRGDEADKIGQKMRRLMESSADKAVYGDVIDYAFAVKSCHIFYDAEKCGIEHLDMLRQKASTDVKAARAAYKATQSSPK
ncbi:MAG: hypothetical protein BGO25_05680 [Acidobacteriales bacterium 59-55]|nr:MAG: hypothetical protein BGO25_05680 [Acidobacteriales bacterium 59-55]